ncbi:hypothetical protein BGZ73_003440 [Actinomortierella ambigua]|nr:hypothetical protein BGZ73_003440 [Actinomortierella ambigua]
MVQAQATTDLLPIIDLGIFLSTPDSPEAIAECKRAADAIRDFGALIVKDPRVTEKENNDFIDMIEDYFAQPTEVKLKDARPEYGYQVGVTPELTEDPKCPKDPHCLDIIDHIPEKNRPLEFHGPDPKWRFFWRIGETPEETKFPRLNAAPVVPEAFKDVWTNTMDAWGNTLHRAVVGVSEMIAVGFGMPAKTFSDMTKYGPHLLAPTASDLTKYGKAGTVLAGFHYDLNFLTIHGKSRYPGLNIWPRNEAEKLAVRVPDGCLLVQAGKQMEWLTGGVVQAGYHEVVVNEATMRVIENKTNDRPLWRISSTMFLHIASDNVLRPLEGYFDTEEARKAKYPKTLTGDQVRMELGLIELMNRDMEN